MTLRVIAGKARGRKLKSVAGDTTRPITDRVKESLFNILAGAVGIEALSRGASFVRFSDANRAPIETITSNLEHCGFKAQAEIRQADAFAYLSSPPDRNFEYIYIAPPQYQDMWTKALELVDDNIGWLTDDGWVIAQIDPKEYTPLAFENIEEFEQRRYGSTLLVFYERKNQ